MKRSYNQDHPPGEGVEPLLRAFFRSEMPSPWPAMSRTRPAPSAPAGHGTYARLALAASVAVLLFAGWYLAGGLTSGGPTFGEMGPAGANKRVLDPAHLPPMDP